MDDSYDILLIYKNLCRYSRQNYQIVHGMDDDDFEIIDYLDDYTVNSYSVKPAQYVGSGKLFFNTEIYMFEIFKSYSFKCSRILRQFTLDLPRSHIMLNNKNIRSVGSFKNILKQYQKSSIKINRYNISIPHVLTMLCNQSSYALPYMVLQKIYQDEKNDIFVLNSYRRRVINLVVNKDNINYNIDAEFVIKNVKEDSILNTIRIKIFITFNRCNKSVYTFEEHSMFEWELIK